MGSAVQTAGEHKMTFPKETPVTSKSQTTKAASPPGRRTQVKPKTDLVTARAKARVGPKPSRLAHGRQQDREDSGLAPETGRRGTQSLAQSHGLEGALDSRLFQCNRGRQDGPQSRLDQDGIRGAALFREALILPPFQAPERP